MPGRGRNCGNWSFEITSRKGAKTQRKIMNVKKIIKIIVIVIVIIIVGIQFIRPERFTTAEVTENHITKKLNMPDSVLTILKRSCFDCHSNHTEWPWYSGIAPMSWLVANDVKEGRSKMNFSEWGKISPTKQAVRLESICEQIREDEMPLPNYLIIHRDAVLSERDKEILCNWAEKEKDKLETEE